MKKSMLVLGLCASSLCGCQQAPEQKAWETMNLARTSVHDPSVTSVIDENGNETFYIFGTHLAQAKSTDLLSWEVPFQEEYEQPEDNLILGNLKENLRESFEWAGYDDGDAEGGYAVWAPDVIWNPAYKWPDGGKGAFLYFYSATSSWRRSCIGFAVAKTIEGPYQYAETIIYSGFTKEDSTDNSQRNTNYQNTNLKELIAKGEIAGFNEQWAKNDHEYNSDYAPNAIDPALFYDEDGRLWLTYGSWSGGIFLLELNQDTGLPRYPGTDGLTASGSVIDRYFGIKLAGGYHQSGEGPFIQYDASSGYYYLFETYGGLNANGGYNMRLFRSEAPDGPYVDMNGRTGIMDLGEQNEIAGLKLMGNYRLAGQTLAYKAQGHNSAIIDQHGQNYLIFHTRFSGGGEQHEVRVHPLEKNQAGWIVALPFEYTASYQKALVPASEIAGTYEFVMHGLDNGKTVNESLTIALHEDHSVSGDVTGIWEALDDGYFSIVCNERTYQGIITRQMKSQAETEAAVVFSAVGQNETVWGIKKEGE